jgi:hypothetical protein
MDDILGQTIGIYIIVIAGAESAIGLAILVAFYRLSLSISTCLSCDYQTYSQKGGETLARLGTPRFSPPTLFPFYPPFSPPSLSIFRGFATPKTNRVSYSTVANNNNTNPDTRRATLPGANEVRSYSINPWFITGLFDAECSFVVTILKNSRYKTGWNIQARVQIKMHEKDRALIQSIQEFFGGIGYVSKPNNSSTVEFRVSTLKDLVYVILHFDNYPLITKKSSDYQLFKQVVSLMLNKEHSTLEGIQKAVNIKASLNWGLSNDLKEAFPETIPTKLENST